LVLLNKRITARKILEIVLMIEPGTQCSVNLLKINIMVLDDTPPNCARKGVNELLELHKIDHGVDGLIGGKSPTKTPGLFEVRIGINTGR
jgi:hypothetical protein